jgi:hypothetical protein
MTDVGNGKARIYTQDFRFDGRYIVIGFSAVGEKCNNSHQPEEFLCYFYCSKLTMILDYHI